jgi:hypothetical protein
VGERRIGQGFKRIEGEKISPGAVISSGDCGSRLNTPDRWGPLSARGEGNGIPVRDGVRVGHGMISSLGRIVASRPFSIYFSSFPLFLFLFSISFISFSNLVQIDSNQFVNFSKIQVNSLRQ